MEQDGQSLELVFEYKASNEGFQNPVCWLVRKFHSHNRHRFELAAQSRANGRFGRGCSTATALSTVCPNNHCERYSTAASCSAGLFF